MDQQNIIERHQARYTMQFRFIPEMVEACQAGELPIDALGNFNFWHKCLTDDSKNPFAFEWNELTVDIEHISEEIAMLKYSFPLPMMEPEVLFAAVVMNRAKKTLDYYTLEKSFNQRWAVCNPSTQSHKLIGELTTEPTIENFIEYLKSQLFA